MNKMNRFLCAMSLALVAATSVYATDDGTDVTSLLVNGKFDGTGGWTITAKNDAGEFEIISADNVVDAQNHVMDRWWNDWKAEQTVENVENGIYKLEVQALRFCSWDWDLAAKEWLQNSNGDNTYNSYSYIRLNEEEKRVQNVFACGETELTVGYYNADVGYHVPTNKNEALQYFNLGLYDNVVEAIVTDNTLKVTFDCTTAGFWNCFYNIRLTLVCSEESDRYQEEYDRINHVDNSIVPHSPKLTSGYANPLVDHHFIADPTSIEYEGRLYVYGTNDTQQYEYSDGNSFEKINTLSILSTDDMVNWTYHGEIPVHSIASYCNSSWAPSIVSRVEDDGLTHFYLYYSHNGGETNVLTATSPVGPWTAPLSKAMVNSQMAGITGSAFDPGAVIDDNGVGWLAVGGGSGRIVKLGTDMISFDSEFVDPHPQYHFEANELNFIGGKYVYTYNLSWEYPFPEWSLSSETPSQCCMGYMVSGTPLDGNSWIYGNNYLKNPGEYGFSWGNNHTHLQKYAGKWYILYHTVWLQDETNLPKGGFRSLQVDEIEVDEENVHISLAQMTKQGVSQIKALNPYAVQQAETAAATEGVTFVEGEELGNMVVKPGRAFKRHGMPEKSIIMVRMADFGTGSTKVSALLKGQGTLNVHLGSADTAPVATLTVNSDSWTDVEMPCEISDTQDLVFTLEGKTEFDSWRFYGDGTMGMEGIVIHEHMAQTPEAHAYNGMGMQVNPATAHGLIIQNGKKRFVR